MTVRELSSDGCPPVEPRAREDTHGQGCIRTDCYHRGMAMMQAERQTLAPATALFRGLADPVRLAILRQLAAGEARVVDLERRLGLGQSTVSAHLGCLRECGLVDFRAVGRQSFYSLTCPELMDLLASAESVLAATGQAVALCPTYGVEAAERQTR